jgi:hypothetical protein
MAQPPFPASTNVDGSNPGPNYAQLPDTVQMPTGNIWKVGRFALTLSPVAVAAASAATQAFSATGIGLLTTDTVLLTCTAPLAGVINTNAYVSATDTLSVTFVNPTAGPLTPTASTVYYVTVFRVQPNWTAPVSGNQMDW